MCSGPLSCWILVPSHHLDESALTSVGWGCRSVQVECSSAMTWVLKFPTDFVRTRSQPSFLSRWLSPCLTEPSGQLGCIKHDAWRHSIRTHALSETISKTASSSRIPASTTTGGSLYARLSVPMKAGHNGICTKLSNLWQFTRQVCK